MHGLPVHHISDIIRPLVHLIKILRPCHPVIKAPLKHIADAKPLTGSEQSIRHEDDHEKNCADQDGTQLHDLPGKIRSLKYGHQKYRYRDHPKQDKLPPQKREHQPEKRDNAYIPQCTFHPESIFTFFPFTDKYDLKCDKQTQKTRYKGIFKNSQMTLHGIGTGDDGH